MIIFGTRGIKSTIKEGQFLCPQCANNQRYKHKKVTKFFTLYFIPLIPLGSAGEFVECQRCKGTFISRVLDFDPAKSKDQFQSQYEKAMRHSMILMMLADGHIDDEELNIVEKIINKFGHNDISRSDLDQLIEEVEANNEPVQKYLSKIAPSLNEHGKEIIIKCGLAVASADGHIDDSEMVLIFEMAKAMEMSSSHVKGITQDIGTKRPAFSQN
ncbi:MAG: TerB family tellurite resistance protein [Saprospiraceae bacterium]|nr:TerB family tellurite resistance protein [Saprospiraceae bacterium]